MQAVLRCSLRFRRKDLQLMMSFTAVIGSVELGLIYAILALGVFLSYRTLNTADLTVDGSIVTGAAVSAMLCSIDVHPLLALIGAFAAGALAGAVTSLLNIKLKIEPLLAGILVMLGLYSINMHIMGNRSNLALLKSPTLYKMVEAALPSVSHTALLVSGLFLIVIVVLFYLFLNTRLGFCLRATGDNEYMVRASGINSNAMKILGLAMANGFVGLAGGLLAQYQSYAEIGMGTGIVVIGLASVIIGETIFDFFAKSIPLLVRLIAVCTGAVLYRLVIAAAINAGMPANDMKLVSALIVTVALSVGPLKAWGQQLLGNALRKPVPSHGNAPAEKEEQ